MSLLQELDFVNSIDTRLRVLENKLPLYELPKGIKNATWFNQQTQNPNSLTSTQYQLYNNENQIVSDYFIEEVDLTITFSLTEDDTNNTTRPFLSGYFAPRLLPLTNASQSISIVLNGQVVQVNPQNMLEVITAFNKSPEYVGKDLPCCSTLDSYADILPANAVAIQNGSITNPLLDYFTTSYGFQPRFGSVQVVSLDNTACARNATTQKAVRLLIREPIFTGITSMTCENAGGFLSATNIQITRNFVSNLASQLVNYIVPAANLAVAGSSVAINSAKLFYQIYTPDDAVVLPKMTYYPIVDYANQSQTATNAPVAPNASITINSQVMSLNNVPRCIYAWIATPDSARTLTSSQAPAFQITGIQLSFNGVGGQFSSMTSPIEIYDEFMGRQGCVKSFYETGYATQIIAGNAPLNLGLWGSCLRIDSSVLAGIDWEKYSVGSQFNANLQIQLTGVNLSQNNQTPSLFIQVVNDALLCIDGPNSAQLHKSILDVDGVMAVRKSKPTEFNHSPIMGGSFFGKVGNFLKKAYKKLKPVAQVLYDNRDKLFAKKEEKEPMGAGRKRSKKHRSKKMGSAMLGEALRKHRRHHYRGGAIEESDESCDSDCSCENYSTESYTSESDNEPIRMRGGSILTKTDLRKRL